MKEASSFSFPCVGDILIDSGERVIVAGVFWGPETFWGKPVIFVAPEDKLDLYFSHIEDKSVSGLLECAEMLCDLTKTDNSFSFVNLLADGKRLQELGPATALSPDKRESLKGLYAPGREIDYNGRLHAVEGQFLTGGRNVFSVKIVLKDLFPTRWDPPSSIADLDGLRDSLPGNAAIPVPLSAAPVPSP